MLIPLDVGLKERRAPPPRVVVSPFYGIDVA
jgi:hypothetical protein